MCEFSEFLEALVWIYIFFKKSCLFHRSLSWPLHPSSYQIHTHTHIHTVFSGDSLSHFPQCSYIPKCGNNFEESMSLVNVVMENFRKYQHFSCYSDPEGNQKSVILTKLYSSNVLFHSLFWPTCMMAGGVAIVAMVKLTQYLSLLCERIQRINR